MIAIYSSVPDECLRPRYKVLGIIIKKLSSFDLKRVISYQVIIFSLDFAVRITYHVQTLILDVVSSSLEITSDLLTIKTSLLLGAGE